MITNEQTKTLQGNATMERTLKLLDETVNDCDFVATCHYVEAEGNRKRRVWFGLPSLFINIVVGSVLVADLSKSVPDTMKWIGGILALLSSFLVGVQTFYGFDKTERGHRQLGNKFNKTSRTLATLKAEFFDKLVDASEFLRRFEAAMKEYEEVCKENEETPPSRDTAQELKDKFDDKLPNKDDSALLWTCFLVSCIALFLFIIIAVASTVVLTLLQ